MKDADGDGDADGGDVEEKSEVVERPKKKAKVAK